MVESPISINFAGRSPLAFFDFADFPSCGGEDPSFSCRLVGVVLIGSSCEHCSGEGCTWRGVGGESKTMGSLLEVGK